MNKIVLALFFLSLPQIGCSDRTVAKQSANLAQLRSEDAGDINKDRAFELAKAAALKRFGQLENSNELACDDGNFWLIYLESKDSQGHRKLLEYTVRKRGGLILGREDLPIRKPIGRVHPESALDNKRIDVDKAIQISESDIIRRHGSVKLYRRTVCELNFAWRIIYRPPEGWAGGGPHYLIDKSTGEILALKGYQ